MSDNLIPANIMIADRHFRIKVEPADEETVRHSIKIINDKVMEFKKMFPGKDMQDYVSMVLIWFATEFKAEGVSSIDTDAVMGKLNQLEAIIDSELGE
ncbi:MAG: cell division protein ZapA [Niabella sp.]|nr:cell division protein ZapA [Niabella sp.]